MTVTEGRFNELSKKVNDIGERLAKIEGANGPVETRRGKLTPWLPIGVPIVALIALMATVSIHLDNKIGASQRDIQAIGTRLGKLEDAIKVLSSQQSNQTQKLIHDLLSVAKTATNPTIATKAIQVATVLAKTLREEKHPATPEFFQSSIEVLNEVTPRVAKTTFATRIALAEYRSSLEPVPELKPPIVFLFGKYGAEITGSGYTFRGISYDATNVTEENFKLEPPNSEKRLSLIIITDAMVKGGHQTLDGLTWVNVVFIGTKIAYHGGPVQLVNVRFINCSFEAPPSSNSAKVADYVALWQAKLKVS